MLPRSDHDGEPRAVDRMNIRTLEIRLERARQDLKLVTDERTVWQLATLLGWAWWIFGARLHTDVRLAGFIAIATFTAIPTTIIQIVRSHTKRSRKMGY